MSLTSTKLPCDWDRKESACNARDPGSNPGSGRSPGEGIPFQYSCLENPTNRGAWQTTVHGVAKSQTWLSDWHFHFLSFYTPNVPKNWCFWTVVLEKTLESPLDCKEIQPVHPKGNESWICIGRTDAEAKAPVLWPPNVKNWFIGRDPDAGKDQRQEEKGMTEVKMVGWHHRLDGHHFE